MAMEEKNFEKRKVLRRKRREKYEQASKGCEISWLENAYSSQVIFQRTIFTSQTDIVFGMRRGFISK